MKKTITLFCFIASMQIGFAQNSGIDTMLQKIAVEKNDTLRIDIIYNSMVLIGETNPLLGIKYAQRLFEYAQKNRDKIAEAYAMSYTGKMYGVYGNIEKGLEYALKGKQLAEKTGNEKLLAVSNVLAANIYKSMSDFPKAIKLYLATIQSAEKANYKPAQTWGYQNLADLYLLINQVDSALKYGQKDYELCQQIKYYDFISYTLINLGGIHGKLGNSALALGYFDMAIAESNQSKSPRQLNWALTAKAKYFHNINKNDSAIFYAKKAITAVQKTAFASNCIKPAQLLLDIYRGNNVDSAFKYSELYKSTNDSLFNAKTIQQTQLMTFEDEFRQLQIAAEKTKTEQQRKQNIQYALIALGILIFIITFLFLSRKHITNTKLIQFLGVVALLLVFEFLNLLLHPFLERITHHSPVLMLLALVCIAALLVPLHHKLEKWATHKLVEKNKAIRLASAKKTIEELEKK
jgi:tetratricopeptide (TPR) repeat protein